MGRFDKDLDTPLRVGLMDLSHRIVMAPMTRLRSSDAHVPLDIAITYYTQRASTPGTLLITEATFISAESRGRDANAPGIYTTEQIEQWKAIVDAVHQRGCFIFCQLWHVGRAGRAHELQRLGLECLSSSAVRMSDDSSLKKDATSPSDQYITPRPMTDIEIRHTIEDFATAAYNAVHRAGFDGVEIHAANGYLIDQFTQSACNQRTDMWGGSVENRSRFCAEVARAVRDAVGGDRVGVRLSPFSPFQGMGMEQPEEQFENLVQQLYRLELAYLHLIEPRVSGNNDREQQKQESLDFATRKWWDRPIILAGGFTPKSAQNTIKNHYRNQHVAIAFGRHFVSNPDLPRRILEGLPLNEYDRTTFYKAKSVEGYIDYGFASDV